MKRYWLCVVVLACGASTANAGAIYKCKNEKGEIYYSQTFDRSRCAGGGAQMNEQGMAVKQIERVKTPEEIAAEKAKAEAEAEARRVKAKQDHDDMVLMTSYPGEEDLLRAHQQEIDVIDTVIATTQLQIQSQQKSLTELLASAAEAERAGRPVTQDVSDNISTVRQRIETQNAYVATKQQERAESVAAHEKRLARYRELKARQAAH
jgi:hypothetical protein